MKDSLCLCSWKVNRTTQAEDSSDSSNNFKTSAIFKNDSHKCRRKILANWTYLSPAGPKLDWTYLNLGQIMILNLLFLQRSQYIFVLYLISLHIWPWIKPLDLNKWCKDYEVKDWNHLFYLSDPFTLCVVCKRPSLWNLSNFNSHPPSPVWLFFCHSPGVGQLSGSMQLEDCSLTPPHMLLCRALSRIPCPPSAKRSSATSTGPCSKMLL